ncbi:hypothetical protein GCM10008957_45550 [Deinococcus ruber]|uniref:Uncharacterized protein n=1 Tax=Deinococcus ruber TaxID=1848197 RepID=A0A918CMQ3_9DEIO|nr:hypothetical protein GCM10008957_45550 [Deinococcus ruber]
MPVGNSAAFTPFRAIDGVLGGIKARKDCVAEVVKARRNGVPTIATAYGEVLGDMMKNPDLIPLLGMYELAGGGYAKKSDAVFEAAVVVHGNGKYEVFSDLNAAALELLYNRTPTGIHVGGWAPECSPVAAL